jgi:membrane associated rhomboid family serine protease/Zn-finger nucleic acid-binding protein
MLSCPRCAVPLHTCSHPGAVYFACRQCGGKAGNLALLRRAVTPEFANGLWRKIREAHPTDHHGRLPCPSCGQRMHPAGVPAMAGELIQLDACRNCQMVWFDTGEIEQVPRIPDPPAARDPREPVLSAEAVEKIAPILLERERRMADQAWDGGAVPVGNAPDHWPHALLTYLGFPIEENAPALRRKPLLTWSLAVMCALATLGPMLAGSLDEMIGRYGFLPADPLRQGGMTLLASFFLHGGLLHLVFNLWFLWIAGDNCEDLLGDARYLVLLAGGAALGLLTHTLLDPNPRIPVVGASGGISALLAFYALALPRVRLVICIRLGWYPLWIRMSAMSAVVLWVLIQVGGAIFQISGAAGVSYFAHLGGALAGVLSWLAFRHHAARAA